MGWMVVGDKDVQDADSSSRARIRKTVRRALAGDRPTYLAAAA